MTKGRILAKRLQEVLLDGLWIANTNYKSQIQQIDWKKATHQVGNLNTIALLTFHINYYLSGILCAFENGKLEINDKFSFNMPVISSASDWNQLVSNFIFNSEKMVSIVEAMTNEDLDSIFFDVKYGTVARNIEGVIEHSYYHLGQITLIRKLI